MNNKIYLITTNQKKLLTAQNILWKYGIELDILAEETPEMQSFEVSEIAWFSAEYMANKYNKAVLLTDVWYYIETLNWFPWPFVKQMNHWFESWQILKLMEWKENRRFEMIEALAYCEPWWKSQVFLHKSGWIISTEIWWEWSALDKIIIRDWMDWVQWLYSFDYMIDYFSNHISHYHDFAKFYQNRW